MVTAGHVGEVGIIGAGILGLSLAYQLSEQGMTSLLFERESDVGLHASGKNAGMYRQLYRSETLTKWANRSADLWPEPLRERYFEQTASYVVGRTCPEHSSSLFLETSVRTPDGRELSAVYSEKDGLIDSLSFVRSLNQMLPQHFVQKHFSERVERIRWDGNCWNVETPRGVFLCKSLVIGNGAWANQTDIFFEGQNLQLPPDTLTPYARYLFALQGFPESYMPAPECGFYWNEQDEWYLRRWTDGLKLFSLCDELAADPDQFSPAEDLRARVLTTLDSAFPQFRGMLEVHHSWYCFRTYTKDQKPIWGPDHRCPSLFWLAGFGGFGMSTGFAATKDLSEQIIGAQVPIPPDVILSRFFRPNSQV